MKRLLTGLLVVFILNGCSTEQPKIEFGKDQCGLCKMTIMDKKFGALVANSKGKTIRFDSGECMVNFLRSDKNFESAKLLIINYNKPEVLIEADKAFYLKGGKVNSPMGGQLAAFETREEAEAVQQNLEGDIILWDKLVGLKF
ncbi:MAG: nitrous oxide reductase accessory protein NosL [Chitinophagales bacterium]|nr:nitrous oxide reductase accessory protein NosL [Chitinophagales bacterium]